MRLKNNPAILAAVIIFWIVGNGIAQGIDKVGTTSFQFLKIVPEARGTSMAEAYSSVATNADGLFWNPAVISQVEDLDVSISYLDYLLDITHQSISVVYTVDGVGSFGLMGMMNQMDAILETNEANLYYDPVTGKYNPGLTGGSFTPGFLVLGVSYARQITSKFSFGLTAKYASEDLVYASADQFMFDFGLLYNTGFESLKLAAAIRHFGPEVKFKTEAYPLPQTLTLGVSAYLIDKMGGIFSKTDDHQLLFAFDLSQSRDHAQQEMVGLEYGLFQKVFLRGGYKFNFDEEGLTFGAGLNMMGFRVDYSYNDFGEYFDAIHRITVAFGTK